MSVPRFSAENSLYKSSSHYATASWARISGGELVLDGGFVTPGMSIVRNGLGMPMPISNVCQGEKCCGGIDLSTRPPTCNGDCCPRSGACCADGSCCLAPDKCCPGPGGSSCTSLLNDRQNCGACGHSCAPNGICSGGICRDCGPRFTACGFNNCCRDDVEDCCNGVCRDITSDPNNCGSCGHGCSSGEGCVSGQCVPPCQNLNLSQAAIDKAASLAIQGIADPWAHLDVVLSKMAAILGCSLPQGSFSISRSQPFAPGICDISYCPDVWYCGPGNSDSSPGSPFPHVSDCLNRACFEHDACYTEYCVTGCNFTPQGDMCDAPFFGAASACQLKSSSVTDDFVVSVAKKLKDTNTLLPPSGCSNPPCSGSCSHCNPLTGSCAAGCDGGTTCCFGACVDLQMDSQNCGACGHDCVVSGPNPVCCQGQCECAGDTSCCSGEKGGCRPSGTFCCNDPSKPLFCPTGTNCCKEGCNLGPCS